MSPARPCRSVSRERADVEHGGRRGLRNLGARTTLPQPTHCSFRTRCFHAGSGCTVGVAAARDATSSAAAIVAQHEPQLTIRGRRSAANARTASSAVLFDVILQCGSWWWRGCVLASAGTTGQSFNRACMAGKIGVALAMGRVATCTS